MNRPHGYITFISTLVVSAIAAAVVLAMVISGVTKIHTTQTIDNAAQANMLAHGCVELALGILRQNPSYTGTTNIPLFGSGECEYTVTDGNVIEATGVVGSVTKKVEVDFATGPLGVDSWQEVGEF